MMMKAASELSDQVWLAMRRDLDRYLQGSKVTKTKSSPVVQFDVETETPAATALDGGKGTTDNITADNPRNKFGAMQASSSSNGMAAIEAAIEDVGASHDFIHRHPVTFLGRQVQRGKRRGTKDVQKHALTAPALYEQPENRHVPHSASRDKGGASQISLPGEIPESEEHMNMEDAKDKRGAKVKSADLGAGYTEAKSHSQELQKKQTLVAYIRRVVHNDWFDLITIFALVVYAIVTGIEAEYGIQNTAADLDFAKAVDGVFIGFFFLEICLRFAAHGLEDFFRIHGWEWIIFDLFTITLVVCRFCIYIIVDGDYLILQGNSAESARLPPTLLYLRFFRIIHTLDVSQFSWCMLYLQEVRALMHSVISSVRSLIWTMLVLWFIVYLNAVYFTTLVANYARTDPDEFTDAADLRLYWGSLGTSAATLFKAVTGGIDWCVASDPLAKISWGAERMFFSYIVFVALFILNIATGIFVDASISSSSAQKEIEIVAGLRDVFNIEDDDGDGEVSWGEFEQHCMNPKLRAVFSAVGLDVSEAQALFKLLDCDGSGAISLDEFVDGCIRLRGTAKSIDVATLMYENRRTSKKLQQMMLQITKGLDILTQGEANASAVSNH